MTSQTVLNGSTNLQTSWTYDQNGLPLSMTTPRGNVSGGTPASYTTNYAYDQAGNLATTTGPPVPAQTYQAQAPVTTRPVTTYGYDTYGDQTQAEDPNRNITVTGYDGDGRVTSVAQPSYTPPGASSPITATTKYAYDGDGNLVQVTDPATNITSYTYDALGDLTSQTDPQLPGQSAPGVWTYSYDAAGELLSAIDPLHNSTQATYDYFGNQATATDARSNTTHFQHGYLGDLTQVTTPDGAVTKNTYDHLGELTSTADSYGDSTSYAYNRLGEVSQINNPDTSFAQYGYDSAGNLTSLADYSAAPPGQGSTLLRSESFGYDPDANLTSVKNWNGNTTAYSYNAAGELTSQVQPVTASSSDTTSYGYDPAGNQTSLTDGNTNTTWTTYNAWELPESVIEPATPAAPSAASRTWTTSYGADGQVASVSQPGGITQTYGYDPLGDLTSQAGSGAAAPTATQSFGYDMDGQLTSATAPGGTDSFSYNPDSQLAGTSGPSGSSSFNYNGDGLMSSRTDAARTTNYTYDNADRLATVADPLTGATLTYGYNSDSLPSSVSYATGGTAGPARSYLYTGLQQLSSDTLKSAGGATIASASYGYNPDGDLTSQTTTGYAGSGSTSYGYNQADELTSATTGSTTTSYGYDAAGNLTQAGGTSYNYNAQDQLTSAATSAGTTSYGYTLSGALASVTPPSGPAQSYASNAFGQNTTAPGGISYGYDALGRLATRTTSAGTAGFDYSGTGGTLASDGTTSYSYDPSGSLVAAQRSGGTAVAALSNLHGDVTGTFSPGGSTTGLAASAAYNPYGSASATSGSMPSLGYQGQYADPATGQVDMSARWYSPATGSFTSNDTVNGNPLPSTVDGNPYAYAGGSPLTNIDPSGHCWLCWAPVLGLVRTAVHGLSLAGSDAVEVGAGAFWGTAALLGAAFWAADAFFFPTPTASGCGVDIICGSQGRGYNPGNAICYYCHGSPASGGNPGGNPGYGYYGATGGYGYGGYGYAPVAPPPPPPPPQDCYAGPDPGCTPPPAPQWLRHDPYETSTATSVTSLKDIPRNRVIQERVPPQKTVPTGANPTAADIAQNAAAAQGSNSTVSTLINVGVDDVGVPATASSGGGVGAPPVTMPQAAAPGGDAGSGPGLPVPPPFNIRIPQPVAASAGDGKPPITTAQQDQARNCFNSTGPSTYAYGPLDNLGGTIDPGRATGAVACLAPIPTPNRGKNVLPFPGFDRSTMNRAHLLARQFGGSSGRVNIVPFYAGANQGRGTDPLQMQNIEDQIAAALANNQRVYYFAIPVYPTTPTGLPNQEISPYWPLGIGIVWGTARSGLESYYVPNVP